MAKNLNDIAPDIKKFIDKHRSKKVMGAIAKEAKGLIVTRTRLGSDSKDRSFAELKQSTKDIKAVTSKLNKLGKSTKARLTHTGSMLKSISSKSKKGQGTIYFRDGEMAKRAKYNEDGDSNRNREPREFFDISKENESELQLFIRDIYRKLLNLEV